MTIFPLVHNREIPDVIMGSVKVYGPDSRPMIEEAVQHKKSLREALQVQIMQFRGTFVAQVCIKCCFKSNMHLKRCHS